MAALILIAIIATVYLLITDKTEEKIKEIIKNFDYKKVVIILVATIFLIVVPTLIYKNVIKYPYDSYTLLEIDVKIGGIDMEYEQMASLIKNQKRNNKYGYKIKWTFLESSAGVRWRKTGSSHSSQLFYLSDDLWKQIKKNPETLNSDLFYKNCKNVWKLSLNYRTKKLELPFFNTDKWNQSYSEYWDSVDECYLDD